jgi:hypothetical protein
MKRMKLDLRLKKKLAAIKMGAARSYPQFMGRPAELSKQIQMLRSQAA